MLAKLSVSLLIAILSMSLVSIIRYDRQETEEEKENVVASCFLNRSNSLQRSQHQRQHRRLLFSGSTHRYLFQVPIMSLFARHGGTVEVLVGVLNA